MSITIYICLFPFARRLHYRLAGKGLALAGKYAGAGLGECGADGVAGLSAWAGLADIFLRKKGEMI